MIAFFFNECYAFLILFLLVLLTILLLLLLLFLYLPSNQRVRRVDITTGEVTTLCGNRYANWIDGSCSQAAFNCPFGIAADSFGNLVGFFFSHSCFNFLRL